MDHSQERKRPHLTARRGFVAATGFGMVGLYLLWAAYGAAPLGLGRAGHGDDAHDDGDGHGGGHAHGGELDSGAAIAQFRSLTEAFVAQHGLADGSVRPRGRVGAGDGHGHATHGAASHDDEPVDVYLMAFQFGFTPAVLRLEAGVPYRFRMMAVDVAHGASLRLGPGARIVRLRPGILVEQEYTFRRTGEYLLYCTVYCGLAHDQMKGRIVVADGEGRP